MQTECIPKLFEFEAVERRSVVAGFDGGTIARMPARCCWDRSTEGSVWYVALPPALAIGAIHAMSSTRSRRWWAAHLRAGIGV